MNKCVNGVLVPLSPEEIVQHTALREAYLAKRNSRAWKEQRVIGYGSIESQLDMIYHQGLESWKTHIASVKNANPKPQ